jgi:hypothetical protein
MQTTKVTKPRVVTMKTNILCTHKGLHACWLTFVKRNIWSVHHLITYVFHFLMVDIPSDMTFSFSHTHWLYSEPVYCNDVSHGNETPGNWILLYVLTIYGMSRSCLFCTFIKQIDCFSVHISVLLWAHYVGVLNTNVIDFWLLFILPHFK